MIGQPPHPISNSGSVTFVAGSASFARTVSQQGLTPVAAGQSEVCHVGLGETALAGLPETRQPGINLGTQIEHGSVLMFFLGPQTRDGTRTAFGQRAVRALPERGGKRRAPSRSTWVTERKMRLPKSQTLK